MTPTNILTPQPTYNEVPYFINPRGLTPQCLFPGATLGSLGSLGGGGYGSSDFDVKMPCSSTSPSSSRPQSVDGPTTATTATTILSPTAAQAPPSMPPQKELEFVVQNFPAPADDGVARPKIKTPAQYTFQVSGPEDYKEPEAATAAAVSS